MNAVCLLRRICSILLLSLPLFMLSPIVMANDHGGGGAPEPMVFTMNLGKENYVQFGLVFETAKPEAMALITTFKPRIQHEIILLMADKDVAHLRSLSGKKELIEEIIELTNRIIDENEKTGVNEVLFSKFLIQ